MTPLLRKNIYHIRSIYVCTLKFFDCLFCFPGTVYVAFGSVIRWDGAPVSKLNAFLDALERIAEIDGYRVIFSFRGPLPPGRKPPSPDRVRLVNWAPQLDVLSHPRTRVFLSHSGLKR